MASKIVEVNGIKFAVETASDFGPAALRIGSRVKVLVKTYSDEYKSFPGIIVGFDNFKNLPTINIIYCKVEYNEASLVCFSFNEKSDRNVEVIPDRSDDSIEVNKAEVLRRMDRKIEGLRADIEDLEAKRKFFMNNFGKLFQETESGDGSVFAEAEKLFASPEF